jgi:uncharacterized protein (TIGR00369 family)
MHPLASPELANQFGSDYLPGLIGLEFVQMNPDEIICRLPVRRELLAPNGFLHAASVIALADTVAGYGTVINLPQGAESFTTIELKSNFFGTLRDGVALCHGHPTHRGRSTQVWDAEVTCEATGKRLALFRCSQMILWPKA